MVLGAAGLARMGPAGRDRGGHRVIWGWGVGQYPYLLEDTLTIEQAAAPDATLTATLVSLAVGAVVLVPSLVLLFTLTLHDNLEEESAMDEAEEQAEAMAGHANPVPEPERLPPT